MATFRIIEASLPDIERILVIQAECGLSPWTPESYEAELGRPDAVLLVARSESDETVGFIIGRVVPGSTPQSAEAAIFNIGTQPEYQKLGIGSLLLESFIKHPRSRHVETIWLEVRASNSRAIGFYSHNGFIEAGKRRAFYSNPVEDALIMRLPVEHSNK